MGLGNSDPRSEQITIGRSGARVTRRGGVFRKESNDPRLDLVGEGRRLAWLRTHGIPAAEVLECRAGLLVTAEISGRSAAEPWPAELLPAVVDGLAEITRALHSLPLASCPFDRRLAVTIAEALSATTDLDDLDAQGHGWTREQLVAELLATLPQDEDLVVCHGDLCLPNVLFDPGTGKVTGLVDAGRLGVADRWVDLAIATRSLTSRRNPQYGTWAADRYLRGYGTSPNREKITFYRLLDEFA